MFTATRIDAKDVQVETKTVLQEKRQSEGSTSTVFLHKVHVNMFAGTSLGHNVAGNKQDLLSMTLPCLYAYLDTFYVPERLAIIIVGQVGSAADTVARLESTWAQTQLQRYGRLLEGNDLHEYESFCKKWKVMASMDSQTIAPWPPTRMKRAVMSSAGIGHSMLSMAFPCSGKYSEDELITDFVGSYLAGTMISPLFQTLREEKGWVYSISYTDMMFRDVGLAQFVCSTRPEVIAEVVQYVRREIQSVLDRGITNEQWKALQDFMVMRMKMEEDEMSSWINIVGEQILFLGNVRFTFHDWERQVRQMTQERVRDIARKLFHPDRMQLTVWVPNDSAESVFAAVQKVLAFTS
jgi:predicted Zn-dependent peptidase